MARPEDRPGIIKRRLETELGAVLVEVVDESHQHAGHLGAEGGCGHYRLLIVSPRFDGLSRVAAQRLVYSALGELMSSDIHALEMRTLTPDQWNAARG
jgi:BolA protein